MKDFYDLALPYAKQVLNPETSGHPEWRLGRQAHEIGGWANTVEANPQWLKDWAQFGPIDADGVGPYNEYEMVFSDRAKLSTFFVLTPQQQVHLCNNDNCTSIPKDAPEPDWMTKLRNGG